MQYDPKLKIAMDEIKSILKKHDISGFVVLHSEKGFAEFLNHLNPSYSCAKIDNEGIKFKIVTAEVGKEKARALATNTLSMIQSFAGLISQHAMIYMDAEKMLSERFGGSRNDGNITGHEQQNN